MPLCKATNDLFCLMGGCRSPGLVVRGRWSLNLGPSPSFPAGLKVCCFWSFLSSRRRGAGRSYVAKSPCRCARRASSLLRRERLERPLREDPAGPAFPYGRLLEVFPWCKQMLANLGRAFPAPVSPRTLLQPGRINAGVNSDFPALRLCLCSPAGSTSIPGPLPWE